MDRFFEFESFSQVAARGSFRAAAEALGCTPSAVSKQVKALEERLGVRLLNRTTRRVSLTEAGGAFHQRIQAVLQDVNEAEQVISANKVGTFDDASKAVNKGDVRFARMPETATVKAHLMAMKRVSHKNATGETVSAWVGTGPDHYANALNYLMIAIQLGVYLSHNAGPVAPPTFVSARFGGSNVDEENKVRTGTLR